MIVENLNKHIMKAKAKAKAQITYPISEQKLTGIRCEVVIPYKIKKKQTHFNLKVIRT